MNNIGQQGALLSLPACFAFGVFGGHVAGFGGSDDPRRSISVTVNISNVIEEGFRHPKKSLEFCYQGGARDPLFPTQL